MNSTISALCSSLSLSNLWGVFGITVSLLALGTLFALGWWLISNTIEMVKMKRLGGTYEVYHKGKRIF